MHLNVRVVFNAILTFYIRFYVQKSYAKTTILSYYNSVNKSSISTRLSSILLYPVTRRENVIPDDSAYLPYLRSLVEIIS